MVLAKERQTSFQEKLIHASDFASDFRSDFMTEIPACEVVQGGSTGSTSLALAHIVCVCDKWLGAT